MLQLQSGARFHAIHFPERAEVEILKADGLPVLANLTAAVEDAFDNPIGTGGEKEPFLSNAVDGRVVVVVTETVPHQELEVVLPMVLTRLCSANAALKPNAVTIIVGEGLKRSSQASRFKKLFQTMNASGCRVIVHDPILQTMVNLGATSRGTPIWVSVEFANADLKIIIDRISPSPLFGLAESPLRIARCCMSIDSIEGLEEMILSTPGDGYRPDLHPMFDENKEIQAIIGIHGLLVGISNPTGETIRIMAGDQTALTLTAAAVYRRHYCVSVATPFDIAVVSFGPHRAEHFLDLVQSGLLAAAQVLNDGGHVMIIGDDSQKVGTDIFFDYICHSLSPAALIEGFLKSRTRLGIGGLGHSNRQNTESGGRLEKIFGMETIRRCQFRAADPSAVLAEWADEYEGRPRIAVIPEGSGTLYGSN